MKDQLQTLRRACGSNEFATAIFDGLDNRLYGLIRLHAGNDIVSASCDDSGITDFQIITCRSYQRGFANGDAGADPIRR